MTRKVEDALMKKSKFTEEQIAFALRQAANGTRVDEVCRKLWITEQTYYRWRGEYGGMRTDQAKRLKELERENARLKELVADKEIDLHILCEAMAFESKKSSAR